jgi:hypothetical protein
VAARRENELDFEVTVNILGLPSAVHQVDADAVRVMSADITVLFAWWKLKSGVVTRLDAGDGIAVWTLATNAGADDGYVGCRVLVKVLVADSDYVPWELAAAAGVSR